MKVTSMLPLLLICLLVLMVCLCLISPLDSKELNSTLTVTNTPPYEVTIQDWNKYTVSISESSINTFIGSNERLPEGTTAWVDLKKQRLYIRPKIYKFTPVISLKFKFLSTGSDLSVFIDKASVGRLPIPFKLIEPFIPESLPTSISVQEIVDTPLPIQFDHVAISQGAINIACTLDEGIVAKTIQSNLKQLQIPAEITAEDIISTSLIPKKIDQAIGQIKHELIESVVNDLLTKHLKENAVTSPANYTVTSAKLNMNEKTIYLTGSWLGFEINPLIGFEPIYADGKLKFDITSLKFGNTKSPASMIKFIKKVVGDISIPVSALNLPSYCVINSVDFKDTYVEFTYSIDVETLVHELDTNPDAYTQYLKFVKDMGDDKGNLNFELPYTLLHEYISSAQSNIKSIDSTYFTLDTFELTNDGELSIHITALEKPINSTLKLKSLTQQNERLAFTFDNVSISIDSHTIPESTIEKLFPPSILFVVPSIPTIEQYGFCLKDACFNDSGLRITVGLPQ